MSLSTHRYASPISSTRIYLPLLLAIVAGLWATPARARNEVQTITLSGVTASTVDITHPAYSGSASFAPGASAATVDAALEAKFGANTVTVTGSSTLGSNVAPLAAMSGSASNTSYLNNGVEDDAGSNCTFASSGQVADFTLGSGNARALTQARVCVISKETYDGEPASFTLYASATGDFATSSVVIGGIMINTYSGAPSWRTFNISNTGAFQAYRFMYGGPGAFAPLKIGEIELIAAGYYGTYTVEFTGTRGNVNLAQMGSGTTGVSIATTTAGAKEWTPDTGINGGAVGAAKTTVVVGGTLGVSVTGAQDVDQWQEAGATNTSGDTISNYAWTSVNASNSPAGSFTGSGANVTWQAPTVAGTYTLRCEVNDAAIVPSGDAGNRDDPAAMATELVVYVIGGSLSRIGSQNLRYYCGEPVPTITVFNLNEQPPGTTWTWATSGVLSVAEGGDGTIPDATVHATGYTSENSQPGVEWVEITYSRDGVTTTSRMSGLTAVRPWSLQRLSTEHLPIPNDAYLLGVTPWGYQTVIIYKMLDQFGNPMPSTPFNESFGTVVSDPPNQSEDWGAPTATSGSTLPDGTFFDNIFVHDATRTWNPLPIGPQTPLSSEKVQSVGQAISGGSTSAGQGCWLQLRILQYYIDHADAEGVAP